MPAPRRPLLSPKLVRPDKKGRIPLGHLAKGVSSFRGKRQANGVLVLSPNDEVPPEEAWLWKNKAALAAVRRGIEEAAAGPGKSLGSFARYATDEKYRVASKPRLRSERP